MKSSSQRIEINNGAQSCFKERILRENRAQKSWGLQQDAQWSIFGWRKQATPAEAQRRAKPAPGTRMADRPLSARPKGDVTSQYENPYWNALRIGEPNLAQGEQIAEQPPILIKKRVIRKVEVPAKRLVGVPVKHKRVMTTKVPRKVRTNKYVQEALRHKVQEPYQVVENGRSVIRFREVDVVKPQMKEIDSYAVVDVPVERLVEEETVEYHEVPDRRILEVEEVQTFAMKPVAIGPAEVIRIIDKGRASTPDHGPSSFSTFQEQDVPQKTSRPPTAQRSRPSTARPDSRGRPPSTRPPSARPPSARPPSARPPSARPPSARPSSAATDSVSSSVASMTVAAVRPGSAAHSRSAVLATSRPGSVYRRPEEGGQGSPGLYRVVRGGAATPGYLRHTSNSRSRSRLEKQRQAWGANGNKSPTQIQQRQPSPSRQMLREEPVSRASQNSIDRRAELRRFY